MYDSLQGTALIVQVAPRGSYHTICHSVNPNYSHSKRVTERLDALHIKYHVIPVPCKYQETNEESFKQMMHLFVVADCYTAQEFNQLSKEEQAAVHEKINRFIPTCKTSDGTYELVEDEDYIVFHKG